MRGLCTVGGNASVLFVRHELAKRNGSLANALGGFDLPWINYFLLFDDKKKKNPLTDKLSSCCCCHREYKIRETRSVCG